MRGSNLCRTSQQEKYKGEKLPSSELDAVRKVGFDGAMAAFLLVQHTQDAEYRKSSLELLNRAVPAGDASGQHLAFLTDRFRIFEGKAQLYGTQTKITPDGKFEVPPIEDEANVDKRRADLGLEPLQVYIDRMRERYGKTAPARNCTKPE